MSQNANKPLSENPTRQAIGAYAEAKVEIARLTAEKEALVQQGIRDHGDWRSKLNFLEADYKTEVARLTAENERLRKAGDAVIIAYQGLIVEHPDLLRAINVAIGDWNAAKKGRDAIGCLVDPAKVAQYLPKPNATKEGRDAK